MGYFNLIIHIMKFIVHSGYHKTASEFLRQKIFSHLDDVLYLDEFYTKNFYCKAFAQNTHTQPGDSSLFIPKFGDYLLKKIKASKKEIVLISSVDLISYYSNNDVELNMVQLLRLFNYLQYNHDEKIKFKVMMTIRNQKNALVSSYSYHRNLNLRFGTFNKFIQYGLKNQHEMLFGGYHYDLVLKDMRMLYGSNNVQFFVYEKMNENIKLYLQDILDFIGSSHNIDQLNYLQKTNTNHTEKGHRVRSAKYGFIGGALYRGGVLLKKFQFNKKALTLFKKTIIFKMARLYVIKSEKLFIKDVLKEFPQELIPDVDNMYRNSNKKLSQMLNIDLKKYGYIGGRLEVNK